MAIVCKYLVQCLQIFATKWASNGANNLLNACNQSLVHQFRRFASSYWWLWTNHQGFKCSSFIYPGLLLNKCQQMLRKRTGLQCFNCTMESMASSRWSRKTGLIVEVSENWSHCRRIYLKTALIVEGYIWKLVKSALIVEGYIWKLVKSGASLIEGGLWHNICGTRLGLIESNISEPLSPDMLLAPCSAARNKHKMQCGNVRQAIIFCTHLILKALAFGNVRSAILFCKTLIAQLWKAAGNAISAHIWTNSKIMHRSVYI